MTVFVKSRSMFDAQSEKRAVSSRKLRQRVDGVVEVILTSLDIRYSIARMRAGLNIEGDPR